MVDLPDCIITLPPLPGVCPLGQHWDALLNTCVNDTGTTPSPITGGNGRGNLIYVSTLKGLVAGFNAYGTDGTDGNTIWFSCNGLAPNNLTGDALKIRAFVLDPWSWFVDDDGYHLTAGWATTDNGLWYVSGLPYAPVWTQKLSTATAAATLGLLEANVQVGWSVAPSVRTQGFIFVPVLNKPDVVAFSFYSSDNGDTWTVDATKYAYSDTFNGAGDFSPGAFCSFHFDDYFYLYDLGDTGNNGVQPGYTRSNPLKAIWRAQTVPVNYADGFSYAQSAFGGGVLCLVQPYSNSAGVPYIDDNVVIISGNSEIAPTTSWVGVDSIRKYTNAFNPPWSVAYTVPTGTSIGDATMPKGVSFVVRVFNDLQIYAWLGNSMWSTPDGGATAWNYIASLFIGGELTTIKNLFQVPVDAAQVFGVGARDSDGLASVFMSLDWGASPIDIGGSGATSLNTVMSIASGDMANALITVDTLFTGGQHSTAGATGIDVSHYQGTMNWATALAAGVTFAFIKSTQGAAITDSQFTTNWAGAGAQGIQRGAYHYFENATNPTTQANHFVAIATSAGELGYVVDCEDESAALDPVNLKTFLDRVETLTGRKCIIYTRASWWNRYVGFQSWASSYKLWVANWNVAVPTLPSGWSNWDYWQFSSRGAGATYGAQSAFIDLDKSR